MYLTDHDTTTPGTWMTQDIASDLGEPAARGERIVLFKTRATQSRQVRVRRSWQRPAESRACVSPR